MTDGREGHRGPGHPTHSTGVLPQTIEVPEGETGRMGNALRIGLIDRRRVPAEPRGSTSGREGQLTTVGFGPMLE